MGSYFAVLTNRDLPQWAAAANPEVSCIGDGEMARINIEASAALSDWLDLMRTDQPRFRKLVKAAVQLLPFPIAQLDGSTYYNRFRALSAINSAHGRRYLMEAFAREFGSQWLERERVRVLVNPTRALANGILNEHWRNGSGIEDVHARGIAPPRPLLQCRLTKAQEARFLQETAELFVPSIMSEAYRARKVGRNRRSRTRLHSSLPPIGRWMSLLVRSPYQVRSHGSLSSRTLVPDRRKVLALPRCSHFPGRYVWLNQWGSLPVCGIGGAAGSTGRGMASGRRRQQQ